MNNWMNVCMCECTSEWIYKSVWIIEWVNIAPGVWMRQKQWENIWRAVLVGGLDIKSQEASLRQLPDIVIATPGRLIDHLRNAPSFHLDNVEVLILDEADRWDSVWSDTLVLAYLIPGFVPSACMVAYCVCCNGVIAQWRAHSPRVAWNILAVSLRPHCYKMATKPHCNLIDPFTL